MANLEKLDKTINELEKQSGELKEYARIYSEIGTLKQDLQGSLRLLEESNTSLSSLSSGIENNIDEMKIQYQNLETLLTTKIQEIYDDSKNFQRELDADLISRLDRHKSDVQIEIRNEGNQLQRVLESSLKSGLGKLHSRLNEKINKQNIQINQLKVLLIVLLGINVTFGIGLFFL